MRHSPTVVDTCCYPAPAGLPMQPPTTPGPHNRPVSASPTGRQAGADGLGLCSHGSADKAPLQATGPGLGSLAEGDTRQLATVHCLNLLPASQHLWLRLVELRLRELEGVLEGQCLVSDPLESPAAKTWWQVHTTLCCWTGLVLRITSAWRAVG